MDIVLGAGFAAIFLYVLYGVIRAATRDGILAARKVEIAARTRNAAGVTHHERES